MKTYALVMSVLSLAISLNSLAEEEIGCKVSVRDDRTFLVNGEPFFPIGAYRCGDIVADETGKLLGILRDMGFNTVFYHGYPSETARKDLDRIANAGLRAWYRNGQVYPNTDVLKNFAEAFKTHPALLFWEVDDEPIVNKQTYDNWVGSVEIMKKLDPDHPVYIVDFPYLDKQDELARWAKLADVYAFDHYPIPLKNLGSWIDEMPPDWPRSIAVMGKVTQLWQKLAPGKPVIAVCQAFSHGNEPDGFPTYQQSRFMAYDVIINGANGIFYYPGPTAEIVERLGAQEIPQERDNFWFWSYHKQVVKELAEMAPVFAARDADWKPKVTIIGDTLTKPEQIEYRVKQNGKYPVILTANTSDYPATVQIKAPELRLRKIHCWYEDHRLRASWGGAFSDRLEPYAVKIYSTKPRPQQ